MIKPAKLRIRFTLFAAAFSATLAIGELTVGYIETFDSGVEGWVDRDAGEMTVTHSSTNGNPSGSLSGEFGFSVIPATDAFRADDGSSGGAFTGDYRSQWSLISGWTFDIMVEGAVPSSGTIQFGDGTNEYFQSFTTEILATGEWYTVFISLEDPSGWSGPLGSFSNSLFQVDYVEVEFTQSGTGDHTVYLDNFELTSLEPRAGARSVDNAMPTITWTDLRAGETYRVEATINLLDTNSWTEVETFVATNLNTTRPLPPAAPTNFGILRLVLPDPSL